MPERLRDIIEKIKGWWNKYTGRQKTIIVSCLVMVVFFTGIMIYFVSKPKYALLITCDTAAKTSEVTEVLTGAGIQYNLSTDALRVYVQEADFTTAELTIASSGFVSDDYTLEAALSSSLSTTSADTAKRYQLYLEKKLEKGLKDIEGINSAQVTFHIPDKDGTLIAAKSDSTAYIQLDTDPTFTTAMAANLARGVAAILGNDTTANITIVDNKGMLLFAGEDGTSTAAIASSMQELQNQAETYMASKVKRLLIGTDQYNDVEVTSQLTMDYSSYEKTVKEYYANAGYDQGLYASQETYETESTSGVGGVPGTASNGEGTTYVTSDISDSSSSSSETKTAYLPNESSLYSVTPAGAINYSSSSIAVAAIRYKQIREEDAKTQGLLDGTTWTEYKLAHSDYIKLEIDSDIYSAVANATGISPESITIVAYEAPIFVDKESLQINWTTVLSAALFLLILGLLAFVVLRSMSGTKKVEEEEEILVEDLLQSVPEEAVDNIDVETKSETRKVIEKFVDDNPELAASLLRNWLNEDW